MNYTNLNDQLGRKWNKLVAHFQLTTSTCLKNVTVKTPDKTASSGPRFESRPTQYKAGTFGSGITEA